MITAITTAIRNFIFHKFGRTDNIFSRLHLFIKNFKTSSLKTLVLIFNFANFKQISTLVVYLCLRPVVNIYLIDADFSLLLCKHQNMCA